MSFEPVSTYIQEIMVRFGAYQQREREKLAAEAAEQERVARDNEAALRELYADTK